MGAWDDVATYRVFISHGWHDRWIAKQMARQIADAGATPFFDIFEIKKGDRIEAKVEEGLGSADELVALLTPWSVDRNWVWVEIAGAWALLHCRGQWGGECQGSCRLNSVMSRSIRLSLIRGGRLKRTPAG